jgi:hypothetical protein
MPERTESGNKPEISQEELDPFITAMAGPALDQTESDYVGKAQGELLQQIRAEGFRIDAVMAKWMAQAIKEKYRIHRQGLGSETKV